MSGNVVRFRPPPRIEEVEELRDAVIDLALHVAGMLRMDGRQDSADEIMARVGRLRARASGSRPEGGR
jgi:hypothetical protein